MNSTNRFPLPRLLADIGWETNISHSWPVASWLVILIAGGALMLLYGLYHHDRHPATRTGTGRGVYVLRAILVLLAIGMLGDWMRQRHRTSRPELIVCVDDSASMAAIDLTPDLDGSTVNPTNPPGRDRHGTTRLEQVRYAWQQALVQPGNELIDRYDLHWYWISDSARRMTADEGATATGVEVVQDGRKLPTAFLQERAERPVSRLGDSLMELLKKQNHRSTAAMIVFTDGVNNAGASLQEAAELARRRQIPLHFVGVGSRLPPSDVALRDLVAEEVVFVNDLLQFDARLTATQCQRKTVTVRLLRTDSSEVLAEQKQVIESAETTIPIRLSTRPRVPGRYEYRIQAQLQGGEIDEENNQIQRSVEVTEKSLRVLLVSASPSYEFRYLKNLLSRRLETASSERHSIELITILQEADPEYVRQDETAQRLFPGTAEEMNRFDVVVFGDVDPDLIGASGLQLLHDFVTQSGGGLMVLSGPRFTPLAYRHTLLANLLPVELETTRIPAVEPERSEGFVPRLSALGQQMPALQLADSIPESRTIWQNLPSWYWHLINPDLRPGATALVEHPRETDNTGKPLALISLQLTGAGKVMFQSSDESWRWARGADGEQVYARYWQQMLRYLGRTRLLTDDRKVELQTDRGEYRLGEEVTVRLRYWDHSAAPAAGQMVAANVQRIAGGRAAASQTVMFRRVPNEPGRWETQIEALPAGQYRISLLNATTAPVTFSVIETSSEQSRVALDSEALEAAAKLASGSYRSVDTWSFPAILQKLPARRAIRLESLPPEPLWNRWPVALLFIGLITSEWLMRRRLGMV
ncbi:MAG: hypothetical protein ACKOU6_18415 [Planctomycetota bacterium]